MSVIGNNNPKTFPFEGNALCLRLFTNILIHGYTDDMTLLPLVLRQAVYA